MARRSARLQKQRSPTPRTSADSAASWQTAHSEQSPPPQDENVKAPTVVEPAEMPTTKKTKRKSNGKKARGETTKPSQLPQPSSAMTPRSKDTTLETVQEAATPKDRTPIKPTGEEMHPEHHHRSIQKPTSILKLPQAVTPKDRTPIKPPSEEMHPEHHHPSTAKPRSLPQLPQPISTPTPKTNAKTNAVQKLATIIDTATTPKDRTPIKPPGEEMHPALHHQSTAKPLDEARWLGFQALGANTAPPKASGSIGVIGQTTPSKTKGPIATPKKSFMSSPDFRFSFVSKASAPSPNTARILQGSQEDEVASSRGLFGANRLPSAVPEDSPRKKAVPKGKKSRYSDVHMAEFKKMDSIANHPSAFRADPNRFKNLNKDEPATKSPNKLKRTQSKMDLNDEKMQPPASKLVATPLKRTQSKAEIGSSLPRASSTVRLVPPTRDGRPGTAGNDTSAKRIRRTKEDDAASTRPAENEKPSEAGPSHTPARRLARPGFTSRLMTPTKASLLRSQSTKQTSMIPSVFRSPTAKAILSPTNIGETVKEGFRKTSESLHKIAAGTHMSPPPTLDFSAALPKPPATAPVRKQVNFSSSTLEKFEKDELGKSPSPVKLRAGSEVPAGAVFYPKLHPGVQYPALAENEEPQNKTPSRRLTFGGPEGMPQMDFSFESDRPIKFGSASAGTIRMVRKSDASTLAEGKKRKLDTVEETSDKENNEPAPVEDQGRSPKKAKVAAVEAPKTPSSKSSKLPRRTPKSGASISRSRLAFLATPKRFKA